MTALNVIMFIFNTVFIVLNLWLLKRDRELLNECKQLLGLEPKESE